MTHNHDACSEVYTDFWWWVEIHVKWSILIPSDSYYQYVLLGPRLELERLK